MSLSPASVSHKAPDPTTWGDKCFLCSKEIGESDPRGFYTGKDGKAMMLAHRGCLNRFEATGGLVPGVDVELGDRIPPVVEDVSPAVVAIEEGDTRTGPSQIRFTSFDHMQNYILTRGPVPSGVRVWLDDRAIRE